MADRRDNFTCRRRLNKVNHLGIGTQRIRVPNATRNDHDIIVPGGGVIQEPIELDSAAGGDESYRHDVRFARGRNLNTEEIRVAGFFRRD